MYSELISKLTFASRKCSLQLSTQHECQNEGSLSRHLKPFEQVDGAIACNGAFHTTEVNQLCISLYLLNMKTDMIVIYIMS